MAEPAYFLGGWEPIARILLIGILGYFAIVAVLKVSGARNLSQMNSFDFIITIAIGATFGRALTAEDVSLSELVAAILVLVLLQYLAATLQVRLPSARRFSQLSRCFCSGTEKSDRPRCAARGWRKTIWKPLRGKVATRRWTE